MGKDNSSAVNDRAGGTAAAISPTFAYVGCNTKKERDSRGKGHGDGISVYRIDQVTGAWTLVQVCDALPNPGFVLLNRNQEFLYSAHGDSAEISAFSVEHKTGKLKLLNTQPTNGDNSKHLTLDPANRYVVLNSGAGLAVFPINRDGSLAPFSDNFVPPAKPGTYRKEERRPCPHHIVFDPTGRFIVVPDRALDKVHIYKLDSSSGKLMANEPPSVASPYGAGPRHLAFNPTKPFAYLVNELDSTVIAYHWNPERGELKPFQVMATTPTTFTGRNTGSEIDVAPSGNFVYASNRGHDSIVIFSVNNTDGTLNPVGWEPTQGKKPRFFTLNASGSLLYAANQDSDSIVIFRVDDKTGKLTPTGQIIETGSPTCIIFGYY